MYEMYSRRSDTEKIDNTPEYQSMEAASDQDKVDMAQGTRQLNVFGKLVREVKPIEKWNLSFKPAGCDIGDEKYMVYNKVVIAALSKEFGLNAAAFKEQLHNQCNCII